MMLQALHSSQAGCSDFASQADAKLTSQELESINYAFLKFLLVYPKLPGFKPFFYKFKLNEKLLLYH